MLKFILKSVFFSLFTAICSLSTAKAQTDLSIVWQKDIFPTQISCAKFSPDGNTIFVAIGKSIYKMVAQTGEILPTPFDYSLDSNMYEIDDMEISSLGNYIVSTNGNAAIDIWDVKNEKVVDKIQNTATSVTIAPDENTILIGRMVADNGNIIVYDRQTKKEITRLNCPGRVRRIQYSHDGKYFVTGSQIITQTWPGPVDTYNDQLILWDANTFKQVKIIENLKGNDWDGSYRFIKFSWDDKYVGSIRNIPEYVNIYDIYNYNLIKTSDITRGCYNFEFLSDNLHYVLCYAEIDLFAFPTNKLLSLSSHYASKITNSKSDNKIFICTGDSILLFQLKPTDIVNQKKQQQINIQIIDSKIILTLNDMKTPSINIEISNLLGKICYTENIELSSINNEIELKAELPTGVYFCNIKFANQELSQKFQIVR